MAQPNTLSELAGNLGIGHTEIVDIHSETPGRHQRGYDGDNPPRLNVEGSGRQATVGAPAPDSPQVAPHAIRTGPALMVDGRDMGTDYMHASVGSGENRRQVVIAVARNGQPPLGDVNAFFTPDAPGGRTMRVMDIPPGSTADDVITRHAAARYAGLPENGAVRAAGNSRLDTPRALGTEVTSAISDNEGFDRAQRIFNGREVVGQPLEPGRSASGHVHTQDGLTAVGVQVDRRGGASANAAAAEESARRNGVLAAPDEPNVAHRRSGASRAFNGVAMVMGGISATAYLLQGNTAAAAEVGVGMLPVPGASTAYVAATGGTEEQVAQTAGMEARGWIGGAVGGVVGGVVGSILPGAGTAAGAAMGADLGSKIATGALQEAAAENREQARTQQQTIEQIRGMSREQIEAAPPGVRENLEAMREAIDVRDQRAATVAAQSQTPAIGRVGLNAQNNMLLQGAEQRLTNLYDDITMDAEGGGRQMQAYLQQQREMQQQAPAPVAPEVAPQQPQMMVQQRPGGMGLGG